MWKLISAVFILISATCGSVLEIPAYEYIKRFNKTLNLGQCPNRIVSMPDPYRYNCTFPYRPGIEENKLKSVDFKYNRIIKDAADLFKAIGLCDEKSVAYFGLLNDGDCVASEIAGKLSFKSKHVARVYLEHYRPWIKILQPSRDLGVPDEYTNHLNNSYYTENIGVGTEEAIIVEMQFSKAVHSQKALTHKMPRHSMSRVLSYTARHIATPRKIKVIRYSTADERLTTKVFKGVRGFEEAIAYVEQCERRIAYIRYNIRRGFMKAHLKYGFKAYELQKQTHQGPISLPLTSGPTTAQKQQLWKDVTLLQVEAKRVYVTHKRFRKQCRATSRKDPTHTLCLLVKQTLRATKKLVTKIHTRRRDWNHVTFINQERFVSEGRLKVKMFKTRLHAITKELKRLIKLSKTG